jgi:hypothetical protein
VNLDDATPEINDCRCIILATTQQAANKLGKLEISRWLGRDMTIDREDEAKLECGSSIDRST